ncbi:alpha/beta hydrolase [Limnohabitans sp.]|uniref:alpha/beta hydrolase n=1 Tax=Limnohabitans sp. TaxID=1907725 RepID=UPI0038B7E25F
MNSATQRLLLSGPAGQIEVVCDHPPLATEEAPKGTVFISHPHPLFGGTMDNKVVQTLARAYLTCGWKAVRFNFRGVGQSQGVHDNGTGECQDLLALVRELAPQGPLALAGFSFGAFVTTHAVATLQTERELANVVLVGTAASRFDVAAVPDALHDKTLVIHGEHDDTVALAAVLDWARPQLLPVVVVPGGGHFFHGQLPLLKRLVVRHLHAG